MNALTGGQRDFITIAGVLVGAVALVYMIAKKGDTVTSGQPIAALGGSVGGDNSGVAGLPPVINWQLPETSGGDDVAPWAFNENVPPSTFGNPQISPAAQVLNNLSGGAGGGCCAQQPPTIYFAPQAPQPPVPIAQIPAQPVPYPQKDPPYPLYNYTPPSYSTSNGLGGIGSLNYSPGSFSLPR